MIQRIQTLYMLFAIIALTIVFLFPFASFFSELHYCKLYLCHLKSFTADPIIDEFSVIPLAIIDSTAIILIIWAIFSYKKLNQQRKLSQISLILIFVEIALIFFVYTPLISKLTSAEPEYNKSLGMLFLLAAIVFLLLANRAIKKDQQLIRSAYRLR